jgi:peptidoglycan hydrolase-like protein with peptidoglycan-binding domain
VALQGLDRAAAPPPAKAKQMLDSISGGWWNVYIGGPESGGSGWTPSLQKSYDTSPAGAVQYAAAWCDAVRAAGVRPGVYANPGPINGMYDVKAWQQKMVDRGWHIQVTGKFDAASEKACSDFQREKQLDVTGHVDRKTWAATWRAAVTP